MVSDAYKARVGTTSVAVWTGVGNIVYHYCGVVWVCGVPLFFKGVIPFAVLLPFLLNLLFNFLFTPLQFGLQSNLLAAIDIVLILGTLLWTLVVIYEYAPVVTYVNIPYVLWVSFATVLQLTITYLNF
jgi:tryptophan-rich sensory protein